LTQNKLALVLKYIFAIFDDDYKKKLTVPKTCVYVTPKWIFLSLRELFIQMVIKRFLLTINHFDAIMTIVKIIRKA
jgi:hypothetical protein